MIFDTPATDYNLGYSEYGNLGRSAFEMVHPDDQQFVRSLFARLMQEPNQDVRSEFRALHRNGSWRWIDVVARNRLADPNLQGIVVSYRDITDRRRAREEGQRFGQILDDSLNEIYIFDAASLGFVRVNGGARRNLGYTMEELRQMTPLDLKPEFSRESFEALIEPVRAGWKGQAVFQTVHRRKNGSTYPVEVHLQLANGNESPVFVAIIQDITERQRAEAALRESQQALEHIVHSVDGIVWEADARTFQFNFVSQQAERLLGYPIKRWLTEPTFWKDHLHPHDRDAAVEFCVSATREGESHQFEYRMLSADGREVWLKDIVTVVFQDGQPEKLRGIMVDITEHKRAEFALIESEQRFRDLYENSRDAIFVEDATGQVRDVNPAACRLHGLTREQLLSKNARDLVPQDQRAIIDRDFPKLFSGELTQIEGLSLHANGTAVPVELSVSHVVHSGQTSLLLHVRDITARMRAEQAVRDNEARLMGLINASMDAIITIDEAQNVVLFNPTAEKMFQCSRAEVLGKSIHQFVPERFFATHDQRVRQFASSGTSVRQMGERSQVTGLRRDGTEFPAEAAILKVQVGEQRYFTVILRDISERKRAEESLREREQQLRLFVEHAPAAIAMLDREMRYLLASQRWLSDYRLGAESVVGRSHYDLFPEIPERWKEIHRRCLAGAIEKCDEDAFPRADGTIDWMRWEIRPWHTVQGDVGGLIIFSEVINERKRAEEKLRASQHRFATVFHSSPVGIHVSKLADGTFLDVNDAFLKIVGHTREEVVGHSSFELNYWLDPEDRAKLIQALQATGSVMNWELRFRRQDGTIGDSIRSLRRITLDGEDCLLTIVEDVTARKQAEAALFAERNLLRTLVDHIPDFIFVKDTQSRQLLNNAANLRLIGVQTDAEMVGKTVFDIYPRELAQRYFDEDQRVMRSGQPQLNQEESVLDQDGHEHWLLSSKVPLRDLRGNCIGLVGIKRDITELKQSEALVNGQNQALELIVAGVPLAESLTALLRFLEEHSPDMLCSIQLLDLDGIHLRHCAAPSLPPEFCHAIDGVAIGPSVGSCGTAAFRREPVIVADIAADPLWTDYRELALNQGLRACWSTPIFDSKRRVLGTFAMYFRQPARPNERQLRLIDMAIHTAAVAISKHREDAALDEAEKTLHASQQRFATVFRASPVGICITTLVDGTFLDVNDAFLNIVGHTREEITGRSSLDRRLNYWLNPGDRSQLDDRHRLLEALHETGSVKNWETNFRRQDGTVGDLLRSLERITLDGEDCLLTIVEDITERKRVNEELNASRKRLEILSRQLIAAQESERQHLARELHDEIGQALTGIKLNLKALQQPTLTPKSSALVQDTIGVVDQTLQQVRSLALDLRPALLDEIGLVATLRWCLDRQSQRAGFAPQFVADSSVSGASPEINTACFRIVQESLTNIARHTKARHVRVELRQDDHELELLVRDDGIGFDVAAARARTAHGECLGLLGMEERVRLIGGRIEIVSVPAQGTTILVRIPIPKMTNDE